MPERTLDHTNQRVGNYHLLRMIGRGGFADVYLGEHHYLKSAAALKMLRLSLSGKDAQRFLEEAQTLVRLRHAHIVRVLDFAIEGDTPVLIMEYISGGSLRQQHPRGTRLPLYMVVDYIEQIATALQYAHNQHIIHRDVKPENILLDADKSLVLSDFGLALFADAPSTLSAQVLAGTLPYMAPEQARGKSSFASDQYALGVIAYEWITGERPFEGNGMQVVQQHLMVAPPPLRARCPDLPVAVEQVVLKALEKDAQNRYVSISAFAHALKRSCFQYAQSDNASLATTPLQAISYASVHALSSSPAHQSAPGMMVFLSAAPPGSEPTVAYLAADLKKRGIRLSNELLQKGGNQEEALRQAIRSAHRVVIVIAPQTRSSRLVREHLHLALMYQRKLVLVWMQGEGMAALLLDQIWKPFLPVDVVDARGERYQTALEELLACLREEAHISPFAASTQTQETLPEPRNPYRGLDAFRQEDAADFFGREALVGTMVQHLRAMLTAEQRGAAGSRLFALVGASGSGKSSAIQAGLLPQLRNGAIPGSEAWIYQMPIVPGTYPLETLALTLAPQFPGRQVKTILADLQDDSARALHWYAARLVKQSGRRVVFIIDQFEELFTQTISQEEQRCFIDLLVTAATEVGGPVLVLLTLRADFYDRPMRYPQLYQLIEAHHQSLLPMEVHELRQVIEGPAELLDVQLDFEGNLVGDLLFEAQGQMGALPLLEFTLYQLFLRRHQRTLTVAAYQEIGGVKGALIRQAELTYTSLPLEEQSLVRVLFLRLVNPGVTEQDATRRRAKLAELSLPDAQQTERLQKITSTFIDARLLTANEYAGSKTVEVSHEALIREWARLFNWLRDAREDIHLQQAISSDAEEWEQRKRPKDRLYRGSQLREARAWGKRNPPNKQEAEFLRAGVQRQIHFVVNMVAIFLLFVTTASAVFWFLNPDPRLVTNNHDDGQGSLRWAISAAPEGSTIIFAPYVRGVILLQKYDLVFGKSLTVQGPGATALTISSGTSGRVVQVLDGHTVTLRDLSFKDSKIKIKFAFLYNQGTLNLVNSIVSGNTSPGTGGGIFNDTSRSLTLNNSIVANNSASYGGGIFSDQHGIVTINNSTISGNKSTGARDISSGGGIVSYAGKLTITNSTISGNTTSGTGGGIYSTGSQVMITFCTIYNNRAQSGGGLSIDNQGGQSHVEMGDSIVAGNRAPTGLDIMGTLTSHGYNLIQNVSSITLLRDNTVPPDIKGISPQIGPLQNNDGFTETQALIQGSPAIDKIPPKACSTAIDQRGISRPQGSACDIGAFEIVLAH